MTNTNESVVMLVTGCDTTRTLSWRIVSVVDVVSSVCTCHAELTALGHKTTHGARTRLRTSHGMAAGPRC